VNKKEKPLLSPESAVQLIWEMLTPHAKKWMARCAISLEGGRGCCVEPFIIQKKLESLLVQESAENPSLISQHIKKFILW
jgi:hypothetical protein